MSKPEEWKTEIRKILQEELKEWKPDLPISPPSSTLEPDKHNVHSLDDLVDCPTCYPKIKDIVLKKEREEREKLDLECVDCGKGVRETDPECPSCGGTEARNR